MQNDIKTILSDSQAVEERKNCVTALKIGHKLSRYLAETLPRRCDTIRDNMQRDASKGVFHTKSYSLDFNDAEKDTLDCERIADAVSGLLPGLGVTVRPLDEKHKCIIDFQHTVTFREGYARSSFYRVQRGYSDRFDEVYTGPDPTSCQALADRLNGLNSMFSIKNVVCKASVVRGMCRIDMVRYGLVQRLLNLFTD